MSIWDRTEPWASAAGAGGRGLLWIFIHGTDKVEGFNGAIFRSCFFRWPPPGNFSADALEQNCQNIYVESSAKKLK